MIEVMFEWADGPNVNAEYHKLDVFSPSGEKIAPRMQQKAYHKNGQWSYADQLVYVPSGSIIVQRDQSTHGSNSRTLRFWVAAAGRPELFVHHGLGSALPTFPQIEDNPYLTQEAFEKILRQLIGDKLAAQWDAGRSVSTI